MLNISLETVLDKPHSPSLWQGHLGEVSHSEGTPCPLGSGRKEGTLYSPLAAARRRDAAHSLCCDSPWAQSPPERHYLRQVTQKSCHVSSHHTSPGAAIGQREAQGLEVEEQHTVTPAHQIETTAKRQ